MKIYAAAATVIVSLIFSVTLEAKPAKKSVNWAQRCFEDYCPCDTSDPDYGGADIVICRNLKMGVRMDPEMIAGAAGLRDSRKALREWRRSNPGY